MNREIKFRAWDKERKIMLDSECLDLLIHFDGRLQSLDAYATIKGTENTPKLELMQYTGLKDRNGKEIFEGDILELINEDNEKVKAICKFGNRRLMTVYGVTIDIQCFYFQIGDRKTNPVVNNYKGLHDLEIIEVIGNIHENPELLEVENE